MATWKKILTSGDIVNADINGSAGIVYSKLNLEDSIDAADLAQNSVDSGSYVDGSIDLVHMSANSVDSDQYVDGSIDTAHFAAGSVDATAMGANSVDSSELVNGSVDLAHMSVNSIDSDQYVDGSIDLAHMSVNSIDSDQYVDGSIDEAHIAADAVNFLTKLKAGTDGELITWDASGDPAAVAVGTSGHVLTSGGAGVAPTFQAVPQGDIEGVTAGDGLSGGGSSGSVTVTLDLNELGTETSIAQADFLAMVDATDDGSEKITFSNVEDTILANINSASSDIAAAAGGAITLADNVVDSAELVNGSVDDGHLSDGVATGLAGTGMTASSGVLNVIGGTGVTANANDIAIGQAIGTGDSPTFTNLTLSGDLVVNGNTITTDTETIEIGSNTMILNSDLTGGTAVDAGFIVERASAGDNALLWYNETKNRWLIGTNNEADLTTSITMQGIIVTMETSASTPGSGNNGSGVGSLWIDTDDQLAYVRTA